MPLLLLLYFLRGFDMDKDGFVLIRKQPLPHGRYAVGYRRYVKSFLAGDDGLDAFRRCFGLDTDAKLKDMGDLFVRYQQWLVRKATMRQMKDGYPVPALEWRNSRGQLTGDKSDDLLPPVAK